MIPRIIAFYLPQFHPIPENDEWWGKGFTEWTNVGKAKKLFPGHYQPRVPADLGYYDLRVPEVRDAQAEMAREAGIEGFCYWHYWFGNGKRLLERPFNEVLESGKPDFPFCLAWANESWQGFAHGLTNRNILIKQLYPGTEDYIKHFYEVLPAFKDPRYISIEGMPVFMIYKPLASTEIKIFIECWRECATANGLKGIYFVGHNNLPDDNVEKILEIGCDAVNPVRLLNATSYRNLLTKTYSYINKRLRIFPEIYSYKSFMDRMKLRENDSKEYILPSIVLNWDHTPRSGRGGSVVFGFSIFLLKKYLCEYFGLIEKKKNKIVFLKSWNEWAEGNYIEPDLRNGTIFLDTIKDILRKYQDQ